MCTNHRKGFMAATGRGPDRKPRTVEEYLGRLSPEKRAALKDLRAAILAAARGAEDCISYQMPALRYRGKVLVWYGATRNHCSFYPGAVVDAYADELRDFSTSKGTIRFQPDHPLPRALVAKLVRARMARIAGTI
jgi:uncharacterized protein YdhG (YjbR/CyaY superfamily)